MFLVNDQTQPEGTFQQGFQMHFFWAWFSSVVLLGSWKIKCMLYFQNMLVTPKRRESQAFQKAAAKDIKKLEVLLEVKKDEGQYRQVHGVGSRKGQNQQHE